MLTLALLAGAALAAQDYSTQVKTPGPDGGALTVHCAPASAAGRLLDTVGAGAELLAAARSPGARIFALPEQAVLAEAAGIDLDGPLHFETGPSRADEVRVRLRDPAAAATALRALDLAPEPDGASRWWVQVDGGARWRARVEGRDLVIRQPAGRTAGPTVGDAADPMVADLLDRPGCRVEGRLERGIEGKLVGFVPDDPAQPLLLRGRPATPPPGALTRPTGAPRPGTSVSPPFLVLALSADPLDLLIDLAAMSRNPSPAAVERIAEFQSVVRLDAGLTVAAWQSPDGFTFAASIPVRAANGRPLPRRILARRVRKMLLRDGIPVRRGGPAALRIDPPQLQPLEVVFEADRVVLGSDLRAVRDTTLGVGPPWVSPALDSLAARAAVVLETRIGPQQGASGPGVLQAGLRSDGRHLELLLDAEPDAALFGQLFLLMGMAQAVQARAAGGP